MTSPQSDILERLRNKNWLWTVPGALREEAANEIGRLRAALEAIIVSEDPVTIALKALANEEWK